MRSTLVRSGSAVIIAVMSAGLWAPAGAHDRKIVGALNIVLGWEVEPAFSGSLNGVIVSIADRTGPLTKVDGTLAVEVTFGGERITLPLERSAQRPHEFRAPLVPTRAGTYTFHVTGGINNQPIDITSTCGHNTFHCVTDPTAIQFPVKDPSVGQLAERLDRSLPRGAEAASAATRAQTMAVVAMAMSIVAIIAAAYLGIRGSRRST
jgi:hypothetical protein